MPRRALLTSCVAALVFGACASTPTTVGSVPVVQKRQGFSAGDEVVTSAQFLLDSESKLREAIQKMVAAAAAAREG